MKLLRKYRLLEFSLLTIFLLLGLTTKTFSQEVTFDVTKRRLTKIKIGVNEFKATGQQDSKLAQQLKDVLVSDLIYVDYFFPMSKPGMDVGPELIVKSNYNLNGNKLVIEGRVYETSKGQMILGKKFSGTKNQSRQLIHALADKIVTTITGEPGIAQTRLAFEKVVNGEKQIFISDYDGANNKQITKNNCPDLFPNLSPKGNKIVYTSYIKGYPQTFISDFKKGKRHRVCGYPGLNTSAAFSPNGKKIALTLSKDGNPEIYTINTNGKDLIRITRNRAVDTSPVWSPDGKSLAFVSNRSGKPQIYIVDIKQKKPQRITFEGSYNTNPCWSPSGDIIVFNSYRGGIFQIRTIDIKTREIVQISSGGGSYESPSFAPDGRHIVFSLTKGHYSQLYLMDIYYKEPHKLLLKGNNTHPDWGSL